jgi:hypothetical protein
MFTSIQLLRSSVAQQDRVSKVANHLKKLNVSWQDDWFFPVVAVGLSNSVDDVEWVFSNSITMKTSSPTEQQLFVVGTSAVTTIAELLSTVNSIGKPDLRNNKTVTMTQYLADLNVKLGAFLQVPDFDWQKNALTAVKPQEAPIGISTEQPIGSGQTPVVDTTEQSEDVGDKSELTQDVLKSMGQHLGTLTTDQLDIVLQSLHDTGKFDTDIDAVCFNLTF